MKSIRVSTALLASSVLVSACSKLTHVIPETVQQLTNPERDCSYSYKTKEIWIEEVADKRRKAIIWGSNCKGESAPVLFYLHGRMGSADESEVTRVLHNYWQDAVVVYLEGTNYDLASHGGNGWEPRFPHIVNECARGLQDIEYFKKLMQHIEINYEVDSRRRFALGDSNGGFFLLTLSELHPDMFAGIAVNGAYSNFAKPDSLNCDDTYYDGLSRTKDAQEKLNAKIELNSVPTLMIFGRRDEMVCGESAYKSSCEEFSCFGNTIKQVTMKNGAEQPICSNSKNYMQAGRYIYRPVSEKGAATVVRIHGQGHEWPEDASNWAIQFFKSIER